MTVLSTTLCNAIYFRQLVTALGPLMRTCSCELLLRCDGLLHSSAFGSGEI